MAKSITTADITFCIKTIHRPWSCHRLVESLRERVPNPNIVVVDDGRPELRFSEKYPETAGHCTVINLEQHDVGVGVGRNAAIDAATTEYIFLLDDDHVATETLHFDRVREYFAMHDLDILAVRQATKKKASTLSDIYDQVARKADTQGVKINVAETKRVLACFFDVLEDYKPAEAFDFVAKGLKRAGTRRR